MGRKTEGEEKRNAKHNENPAAGHHRGHSKTHADKQRGTHLQETAAKLFVHGENKQETNQLQKSMSTEMTANHCCFQIQIHISGHLGICKMKESNLN